MSSSSAPPPPLPKIEGDSEIQFDILTHRSIKVPGAPEPPEVEEYGDVYRLSYLGKQAFRSAITLALFRKKPAYSVHELADVEAKIVDSAHISKLATFYGLPRRIRHAPGVVIDHPDELAHVFFAWFGAVFLRSGMYPIDTFVNGMLYPDSQPPIPKQEPVTPQVSFDNDPYQQFSHQQSHQQYHPSAPHFHAQSPSQHSFSPSPQPPQPISRPPPLPPNHYQSRVSLALFNERASQIGLMVSYPATMSGPPHAPTWFVQCCVNGQEKGVGQGRSQKIAKEQAAQQAWNTMGWS